MIEFIIDCVADFIMDGAVELVKETKIPKWIRSIVLVVLTLVYMAVFVLFAWILVQCKMVIVKCLSIVMLILIIGLVGRFWYKLIKGN